MLTTFLYTLAGGVLLVLGTARPREIAWRFVRLIALLVLAGTAVVVIWSVRNFAEGSDRGTVAAWAGAGVVLAAAALVFLAPFAERRPGSYRAVCILGGLAGLVAGCWGMMELTGDRVVGGPRMMAILAGHVLGSLLLGSVSLSWLLGHAYLTATRMTIVPLRRLSNLLLWLIGARTLFVVASLLWAAYGASEADASMLSVLGRSWLVLSLRLGVGVVGVGAFAFMVADCVRRRSTQSATGILYFASIFAYIGELASQNLVAEYGWPV